MDRILANASDTDVVAFVSGRPEHERSLEEHTLCCLCGTELRFQRETDFIELVICETAECPSCRIRSRAKKHTIQ